MDPPRKDSMTKWSNIYPQATPRAAQICPAKQVMAHQTTGETEAQKRQVRELLRDKGELRHRMNKNWTPKPCREPRDHAPTTPLAELNPGTSLGVTAGLGPPETAPRAVVTNHRCF